MKSLVLCSVEVSFAFCHSSISKDKLFVSIMFSIGIIISSVIIIMTNSMLITHFKSCIEGETKNIVKTVDGAEANGISVDAESLVSMNFWCYPKEFISVLQTGFPKFLENMFDPVEDEYLLPFIADSMLKEGTEFSVLPTDDHWFGVTYKEDKPAVEVAFRKLIDEGEYRTNLYSDL